MDVFDPAMAANFKIALASAAGGAVRMFLRPARTFLQTLMLIFSCITCGFYGTDPFMAWFTLPNDYAGAVGALIGFLGLSVAEGVLKAVDRFNFNKLFRSYIDGDPR